MKNNLVACIETDISAIEYPDNPLMGSLRTIVCRIDRFKALARTFYFEVLLCRFTCPACKQRLEVVSSSEWSCRCGLSLDPTTAFQESPCCRAPLKKRMLHYACVACGQTVASRFLFDERIFDREYFRERMAMSRKNKAQRREELRRLLSGSRSEPLTLTDAMDLERIPGLPLVLDEFVSDPQYRQLWQMLDESPAFSLDTYRRHILDQLSWSPVLFSALLPVIEDQRRDRVRRFVSLIFMQQAGEVELTQGDEDIWVQRMHHETDDQG
jgi:hypothetical protein